MRCNIDYERVVGNEEETMLARRLGGGVLLWCCGVVVYLRVWRRMEWVLMGFLWARK